MLQFKGHGDQRCLSVTGKTFHPLNRHTLSSDRSLAHYICLSCHTHAHTHSSADGVTESRLVLPPSRLSTGSPQKSQKSLLFPHLCLFGRRVSASESRVNTRNASVLKPCVQRTDLSSVHTLTGRWITSQRHLLVHRDPAHPLRFVKEHA